MIYEKEFKKNTYEATLRASLVFRVDGLELPVRVKCSNHLVQNDPYGVELASLAEENLYETYEAKDLLELVKKQNLEFYLDCLENTRAINPKLIKGED